MGATEMLTGASHNNNIHEALQFRLKSLELIDEMNPHISAFHIPLPSIFSQDASIELFMSCLFSRINGLTHTITTRDFAISYQTYKTANFCQEDNNHEKLSPHIFYYFHFPEFLGLLNKAKSTEGNFMKSLVPCEIKRMRV